jgi:hypothetical protein
MLRLAVIGAVASALPLAPPLELFTSIAQPADQATYGALSVTNAWGSLLLSSSNVLAINAIEMAPFSSGWSSQSLYGWGVDTLMLSINRSNAAPSSTQWTPFSARRWGSVGAVNVASEVRWVFEAQAVLVEANVSLADPAVCTALSADVDFRLPLRYYPRADECSSWHYPTHSEPCCWNWFGPAPAPDQNTAAYFPPSWDGGSALSISDSISPAGSAFAFDGSASGDPSVLALGAPDATGGFGGSWDFSLGCGGATSARLRIALVFSNATDAAANVAAARGLAAQFAPAWAGARDDWQARFASVFDTEHRHFSGHLPLLETTVAGEAAAGPPWTNVSAMERIYYSGIVGLLANERTNLPPWLPPSPPACPISLELSDKVVRETGGESWLADRPVETSGLDRYLRPAASGLWPRIRGAGGLRAGTAHRGAHFEGGRGRSSLLRSAREPGGAVGGLELLREQDAPWRVFVTGGGLNATGDEFYWDNSYGALTLAMLEPETFIRSILLWLSSVDEHDVPSYWSFWGYNYVSSRGTGNYYSTNDFVLFELVLAYLKATGDSLVLDTVLSVPYSNGTIVKSKLVDVVFTLTSHWKTMNASGFLADYGLAPNLLECVPTYVHYVASCNAANSFMSRHAADIAEFYVGDLALAAQLRADAGSIAAAVLSRLYIKGAGYFGALMPNGSLVEVQHVMDHVYVSRFLGAALPPSVAGEMGDWLKSNLLVPHWMRALSLNDSAAPLSNRSDHGPSGSYIGWPPMTMQAMAARRDFSSALAFLEDTLFSATLGPYGQAIEIRPPGDPYKPMDVTLYNALVSHSFADVIITSFFGFQPAALLPGQPQPFPLFEPTIPRGFTGALRNLAWGGKLYDVESGAEGLALSPL